MRHLFQPPVAIVADAPAPPAGRRRKARALHWLPILAAIAGAVAGCATTAPEVTANRAATAAIELPMALSDPAEPAPRASLPDNSRLGRDFMELGFYLESGRPLPRFTRFEGPVSITLASDAPPVARVELSRLVTRLRNEAGLEVSAAPGYANTIRIVFVPRSTMRRVVPNIACFVVPNVTGWADYRASRGDPRTDFTQLDERRHATVFIPASASPQEIRDCLHEEVSQALGPVNDLYRLPDTVWNDDNFHTVLTGFDMMVLRAYYDPALHSGMSPSEVRAALPGVLARVNPAGGTMRPLPDDPTPRSYVRAITRALGAHSPGEAGRLSAAREATRIAASEGWTDSRAAFAWFALGRLSMKHDPQEALDAFLRAGAIYRSLPGAAIQSAHVDMQLAAFALASGQAQEAIALVNRALSPSTAGENAALMATLYMIRAEAHDALGQAGQAQQARLDMAQWARYGFGSDAAVRRRASEVATLADAGASRLN